ncbi:hypothetical protein E6P09_06020 [Haloferax mediterranei ATCC 33500]|uniref:Uncharacterized protein n=1 Tax=Haloferax mediterranei (strain ATCC 33500 / DSM 1411 / JCM 8866 / NBRC 14739 / NCIMB 2177 / R-4) TaxID=523841 RepID=I3R261_HALMT|nr:hypothetical protein [Haloferax mediterranei]AFK18321.1 hypothetical protein HFX_0596 [Haloferax mediterranei ATCC 33500]AHZ22282.1 hypothetical protein BM92_06280 [Haloferax mediterranei ATCC 33500]EMA02409.1 hypothetical protein C439_07500 [Haloferax mediterranei ATCC 33500]MDX5988409.1 hypothetical protein [Haloferax mediterranei ATCC 33500]QCQ74836.1 hypothetical protein E6P09_06020 [Haloferax mediterranei ATCC 33500]
MAEEHGTTTSFRTARRAVVPVVGKALEAAIVVLFIGLLTTILFGGVVPDHRDAVGHELADKTLSTAAERVETTATVPDAAVRGTHQATVDIPRSIRGSTYRIEFVQNATLATDANVTAPALVLDHPNDAFDRQLPVTLPESVSVSGTWDSGTDCVVRVVVDDDETAVELSNGGGQ